ncbi:MAG: MBL fold metallo-hydrolase [Dehalococcoidales bacterium]|jgi:ribonuclease BN (tRNA processing enzyme)|nr:MBL fold metallo-hydrolase [Dehalococcoidales bacterium]
MRVSILGAHNTESRDTRLSGLLVDDILALDAGSITSALSFAAQKRLRIVLLTHHHYDHIRDLPALGINLFLSGDSVSVYATLPVADAITSHLFDGGIYPNYLERPPENPTLRLNIIEPLKRQQIEDYSILAVPVSHSIPSVGYQITSADGKIMFYTGDTGPGLSDCWQQIAPGLLVTELTASNRFDEFGRESGHLTPSLLKEELINFRELKGYLPQVVTVHMSPGLEEEIEAEMAVVAGELNIRISLGYEGMEINF